MMSKLIGFFLVIIFFYASGCSAVEDLIKVYHEAWLAEIEGDEEQALRQYEVVVSIYKEVWGGKIRIPGAEACVAHSIFQINEPKYSQYDGIVIRQPQAIMLEGLTQKITLAQKLLEVYEEIEALRAPRWAIAARCRAGDVYRSFGEVIRTAECPVECEPYYWRSLPDGDKRKARLQNEYRGFKTRVRDMSKPLYEKADTEYNEALSIADKAGLTTYWSRRAQEQIEEIDKFIKD